MFHKNKLIVFVFGVVIIVFILNTSLFSNTKWNANSKDFLPYPIKSLITKAYSIEHLQNADADQNIDIKVNFTPKLSDYLFNFPWDGFETSMRTAKEDLYRQELIDGLQRYAIQEPPVPINKRCTPPLLTNPKDIVCSKYPDAFLPNKYTKPSKIAIAIQLGFDADTLEIYLNEVYDVIDYFFIVEATRVHCKTLQKQLIWSDLSVQPRFAGFRNKIIHLVLDDVDIANVNWSKNDMLQHWTLENLQEKLRWTKIKEWNKVTKALSGNDVIGFGDADEIPSRDNIHLLKYCPIKSRSLDIGIWFPFGRLDQAYASDWPVSNRYKYTLGDPTFYRWKDIENIVPPNYPTRLRGKSESFLLGGIHLTYYTYLPYFMLRLLSATECGNSSHVFPNEGIKYLQDYHSLEIFEKAIQARKKNKRIKLLKDVKQNLSKIVVFPWFYNCNKDRYPAWQGNHDPRVS